jgi:hypothetical protein
VAVTLPGVSDGIEGLAGQVAVGADEAHSLGERARVRSRPSGPPARRGESCRWARSAWQGSAGWHSQ